MSALRLQSIDVTDEHIEVVVRVAEESMRTSVIPDLAENAVTLMPGLARHRCDNDVGARFVDELRDTETPHLLEHITIELMALGGSPRTLAARTTWDFARDGRGVFRVRIAYDDDLVALGALSEATHVVEWLLGERDDHPDLDAIAGRLKKLRSQPCAEEPA